MHDAYAFDRADHRPASTQAVDHLLRRCGEITAAAGRSAAHAGTLVRRHARTLVVVTGGVASLGVGAALGGADASVAVSVPGVHVLHRAAPSPSAVPRPAPGAAVPGAASAARPGPASAPAAAPRSNSARPALQVNSAATASLVTPAPVPPASLPAAPGSAPSASGAPARGTGGTVPAAGLPAGSGGTGTSGTGTGTGTGTSGTGSTGTGTSG